jgi:LPXTG-site transpeptidase (sortase) family protein
VKMSKKRRIGFCIGVLLLLSGLLVLIYPKITHAVYQNEVKRMKEDFSRQVTSGGNHAVDVEGLYQELSRRNQELYLQRQKDLKDPFSYEQPDIDLSQYGIEDNVVGFVRIPKMKVELPIYLGANQKNMKLGAVHLTQTSYPIGGVNTNSVIAAHRGYRKTAMFRDIHLLESGDRVYLENFKETLVYEVEEVRIIEPDGIDQLLIQEERDLLTLVTCHPLRGNSQRYVVFCKRIEG